MADARSLLARIPTGQAGLVITDPPWDIHSGPIFDACASYERLSVEAIADIMKDARRACGTTAWLHHRSRRRCRACHAARKSSGPPGTRPKGAMP